MINQLGTIRLTCDASVCFANSLFRPTREAIESHNSVLDKIDSDIELHAKEGGFEAEVADLDLSFLDDVSYCNSIEVGLVFEIKFAATSFASFTAPADEGTRISLGVDSHYSEMDRSVYLPCAA